MEELAPLVRVGGLICAFLGTIDLC
jgi:hypothetical protein